MASRFVTRSAPGVKDAFFVTFIMMFKEEWRQNIDFAKRRRIVLFPLLVALFSMAVTIGLRFLVGSGEIDPWADAEAARETFTWAELRSGLHVGLFLFSLGMGSFAFVGRAIVSKRSGGKSYLLGAPALQPLNLQTTYLAYYVKEVIFYVVMILSPAIAGMASAIFLQPFLATTTPLLFSSLIPLLLCLSLTLAQGLVLSFSGSALWSRGGIWSWVVPITALVFAGSLALGTIPIENAIAGLWIQEARLLDSRTLLLAAPAFAGCLLIAWVAAGWLPEDFEVSVSSRDDLFRPIHDRLTFVPAGRMRILVAKEIVDVLRSGTLFKMLGSYIVPLLFLLFLAWIADFARFPIPFNLLSYAPFLGFFGFNFYSWLNGIDPPDHYNTLPMTVPSLLKAKIITYFLLTTWIGIIFMLLMAWMLDEWSELGAAMVVMMANSIYIVSLSAWLMGLRPNKAIFDAGIMAKFWVATSVPLIFLFLLSWSQGDTAMLENWSQQVSTGGFDAEARVLELEQRASTDLSGILSICGILLALSFLFLRLLDRKWGRTPFEN